MKAHYQVVIIGGGTAGIMVAVQLIEQKKIKDIAIIEPVSANHYQPAWTLVGAGTYDGDNNFTANPKLQQMMKGQNV